MSFWYSKHKIEWFISTIWHKECEIETTKSSGPWWQNVNKRETKVQLSWNCTTSDTLPQPYKDRFIKDYKSFITEGGVLRIDSQVHRTQEDNKEQLRKKLSQMIQNTFKPPKAPRKLTVAPKHAVDARIAEKKRRSKIRANRTIRTSF